MIKLSIIIPYYKTKQYTDELLQVLNEQITDEVQVILVYDENTEPYLSNYDWLEIFEQPDRGLGRARNYGIEVAKGKYIAFIDSDDLVSPYYIRLILKAINDNDFDICQMSWKNIPGYTTLDVKLSNNDDRLPEWNWACWSRIYKHSLIEDIRFPDGWDEDVPFIKKVNSKANIIITIPDYMYLYRTDYEGSRTNRHLNGLPEF